MNTAAPLRTLPMKAAGTQHFIERTYRESGPFQWVRETLFNALEAGATKISYSIEWQAVESLGVYRRVVADNGRGMTADELVAFFNTFGGGGKPIGGVHQNFGVGAKTSLLPWNRLGLVVISWVDGDASMIWVQRDVETGEYGLRLFEAEDTATGEISLEAVCAPFADEESSCDWAAVKPDWMGDNGTVLVLMGNDRLSDTVLGDPDRAEADIKGISSFLNRRLWQIPSDVQITVDELRTTDKGNWPRRSEEAYGPQTKQGADRRINQRTIQGASYFIEYGEKTFKKGRLVTKGTVELPDGTHVDWYLWDGDRPAVQSYAAIGGYIGALYKNELYDVTAHPATYRSFGVSESAVRQRLWLILRPPLLGDGSIGVYPRTDRNALLMQGGLSAGEPLPLNQWAAQFADRMPDAIRAAIKASREGQEGTISDSDWRARLAERFGARWRIAKLRITNAGLLTTAPGQPGTSPEHRVAIKKAPRRTRAAGGSGGRSGQNVLGFGSGSLPASKGKFSGGVPTYRTVKDEDVGRGVLAAWKPNDPDHPEGVVLLNVDHPVLSTEIEFWQAQYPDHHAEAIRRDVVDAYGQIAVAKVAHSEHLKGILPTETIEKDLRSDAALTMSLLGLIAEEAVIATRVGGKYGKRK